jgi:hypothetical protein
MGVGKRPRDHPLRRQCDSTPPLTLCTAWCSAARELLAALTSWKLDAVCHTVHTPTHCCCFLLLLLLFVRFDCAPAAVSASLSVYADGSVLVHHGGIEMGQGLATKVGNMHGCCHAQYSQLFSMMARTCSSSRTEQGWPVTQRSNQHG